MERKTFGLLFLLLIFFASREMVLRAEARVCESKSHGFRGMCARDHNCALVCRNEGFSGGNCRGFRHRCFCTKLC
ncbi:defensin-like protein 1 [Juglans microcarpa x Juglans regia]|uniref:defensin-like protein 1 n=1 Tax=Juglans microcarpa x Juglans regia TaxID=2249226 RepID=UPI001B7DF355|nr:defensin-like protein 1 [Juglans microcarpa x Juglans regia]